MVAPLIHIAALVDIADAAVVEHAADVAQFVVFVVDYF